jgi:hypothetical protein
MPATSIDGLKVAGLARADVGATMTVLSASNSSAWTTTANRFPRCWRPGRRDAPEAGRPRRAPRAQPTVPGASSAMRSRTA